MAIDRGSFWRGEKVFISHLGETITKMFVYLENIKANNKSTAKK